MNSPYTIPESTQPVFTTPIMVSEEAELQPTYHCPNCDKQEFQVSVGFEIPSDSELPNDTSWFVPAAKCASCGWEEIVYDDETA